MTESIDIKYYNKFFNINTDKLTGLILRDFHILSKEYENYLHFLLNECESLINKCHINGKKKKEGLVLFFNYIENNNEDIINLKNKLNGLGLKYRDMKDKVESMEDLQKEFRNLVNQKEISDDTLTLVIFLGYSYRDLIFLGSSRKESISYRALHEEINKIQKKNNNIILFTILRYKEPAKNFTQEYIKQKTDDIDNIFHFIVHVDADTFKVESSQLAQSMW